MDRIFVLALLALLLGVGSIPEIDASADRVPVLAGWYQSVGNPLPGEDFGEFLSRVARVRVGTPYAWALQTGEVETFSVQLDHFECVSLIESSLAVARCAWRGEPTERCLVWERVGLRYRSGIMSSYPSRLHYFVDWLADNEGRWRLRDLTTQMGGRPVRREFFYLTRHPNTMSVITAPALRRRMLSVERDLSSRAYSVLDREDIRDAQEAMRDGDVIGIVGDKPGRLITHAGVIVRPKGGKPRLLHASSYHHRVLVTREDVAAYVMRRPERTGIMVARPLAPPESP